MVKETKFIKGGQTDIVLYRADISHNKKQRDKNKDVQNKNHKTYLHTYYIFHIYIFCSIADTQTENIFT